MDAAGKPTGGISKVRLLVFLVCSILAVIVLPNLITGLLVFGFWLRILNANFGWREATIGAFILSCVLASSRDPGIQYWKPLRLLPAALLVLEAVKILRSADVSFRRHQLSWIFLIVLCTGIPALLSAEARAGFFETVLLGSMWVTMMILGTYVIHSSTQTHRINMIVTLGWAVLFTSAILTFFGRESMYLGVRWCGVFGNPNEISHWWLFVFLLGLVDAARRRKSNWKWLVAGLLLVLVTGTRGALVAMFMGALGVYLYRANRATRLQGVFLVAIFGVVVLYGGTLVNTFVNALPENLSRLDSIQTGGGRFLAWTFAWEEIMLEPWFGQGGGYEERFFYANSDYFSFHNHQGLSHNSWLAFAMNYGIPAAMVLIVGLLASLRVAQNQFGRIILPAMLFSLTIEGWLTAPMSASSPMLFFVGGLVASFREGSDDEREATTSLQSLPS